MLSSQEQLALEQGPDIGKRLPDYIFSNGELPRLKQLIAASPSGRGAVLLLHQHCDGCEELLRHLETFESRPALPLAALTPKPAPAYEERLGQLMDIVAADDTGDLLRRAGLRAAPFLILVDEKLRVQGKQLAGDLYDAMVRAAIEPGPNGRAAHAEDLKIEEVGAR
jgi:hypothetical protein